MVMRSHSASLVDQAFLYKPALDIGLYSCNLIVGLSMLHK